jgi:pyruvate-formate lyase
VERTKVTAFPAIDPKLLHEVGEPFAAGLFARSEDSLIERFARGLKEWAEDLELQEYHGELLYPSGPGYWEPDGMAFGWHYVSTWSVGMDIIDQKCENATPEQRDALKTAADFWSDWTFPGGYTHSIPNYERVLREGLTGFADRVKTGLGNAIEYDDNERAAFHRAMGLVLYATSILHGRIVQRIEESTLGDAVHAANRERLLAAYRLVPFQRPRDFFEAAVAVNFIFYLDGCDDLGRYDQYLWPWYHRSIEEGLTTRDEALEVVRAQWQNVDDAVAWNVAIGGTDANGKDLSNGLTSICLEAARGRRRPNLALRLGDSTPDEVWDEALRTIETGNGLPALYWDPNYFAAMDASGIPLPDEHKHAYAFGGCTELMVQGQSNVGSLDSDINLPGVLEISIRDHLVGASTYEDFVEAYERDLVGAIAEMTTRVNQWQEQKARYQPQPMRSLLIDDCIDTGREFAAGGARYNWSVINVMGLANAVDSLSAIREVVFDRNEITAEQLVKTLTTNFEGEEALRGRLEQAPRYGNGDDRADQIAQRLSSFVFEKMLSHRTWRGNGPFVPSCLMFVTYAYFGEMVGATPDGRHAKDPIADSAGPHQGRDVSGPTAMLRSVASIDQQHAPGTLVVNIRVGKQHFASSEQRDKLKALIRGYFDMGGLQIQVYTVDQEILRDAMEHPERHGDLIVRVGGYSEYWRNLGPELQETILLRTEH